MKTKTYDNKNWKTSILAYIFCSLLPLTSFAGNYTWTGTTSNDWATSTNWSPNGAPTTGDSVTITAGSNNCLLAGNTTIDALFMSDDTVDFNGYTLTVMDIPANLTPSFRSKVTPVNQLPFSSDSACV